MTRLRFWGPVIAGTAIGTASGLLWPGHYGWASSFAVALFAAVITVLVLGRR